MSNMENQVKFLEEHIKELNNVIDQWVGLCSEKDEIIESYRDILSRYSMTEFKEKSNNRLTNDNTKRTS